MTEENPPQQESSSASLPAPQAKPHEGKVQAEKFGYASELLAYRVVDNLAATIAQRLDTRENRQGVHVLLVSGLDHALGDLPMVEIKGQISLLKSAFDEREREHARLLAGEHPEAQVESIAAVGAALKVGWAFLPELAKAAGNIADFLAYFRSNYTIAERDFDVASAALISSLAGNLAGRKFKPVIPGFHSAKTSQILSDLTELAHRAVRLQTQREALASRLPASDEGEQDEGQEPLSEIGAAVLETDAVLLSFAGFRTSWITRAEGQTQTQLEKALIREKIDELDDPYLLWVSTLSSGGEASTRDRLIRDDLVGFMGGAAVSYVLATGDGEVLAADTLAQYGLTGGRLQDYVGPSDSVRYVPEYRRSDDEDPRSEGED